MPFPAGSGGLGTPTQVITEHSLTHFGVAFPLQTLCCERCGCVLSVDVELHH